jgi:hypothetical protein
MILACLFCFPYFILNLKKHQIVADKCLELRTQGRFYCFVTAAVKYHIIKKMSHFVCDHFSVYRGD